MSHGQQNNYGKILVIKEIQRAESFKAKVHHGLPYTELIKMDLNSRQIVNEDSILLYFGGHVIDIMEFTSSFESFKKVFFFIF